MGKYLLMHSSNPMRNHLNDIHKTREYRHTEKMRFNLKTVEKNLNKFKIEYIPKSKFKN